MGAADDVRRYREDFLRGIAAGLDDVSLEILSAAQEIITKEAFDEGTLNRSGEVRKPTELSREIAFTAEHSVYVHDGAEPHWPPLAPIVAWVRRNLSITAKGSKIKAKVGEAIGRPGEAEILRVAKAVRFKISQEGTPAVPYLARAVSQVRPRIATILAREAT